ncbi:retrovirus-related pol polyprotein from transposon TNT 1-94 [Tanacetum coccineum]
MSDDNGVFYFKFSSLRGLEHQTSTAQTPEQNDVVERQNRALVEAARIMLSAAKIPLFFWAEATATATACFTQNHSLNLDKMKEKGDACIFVGYSTQSKGYRVYNKRTRLIVESIHVNFDELPQITSNHDSSDPTPQYETITTSFNELDILFSSMFDEYFNGATPVVSKYSVVPTANASDKRQQANTTPSTLTIVAADITQLDI